MTPEKDDLPAVQDDAELLVTAEAGERARRRARNTLLALPFALLAAVVFFLNEHDWVYLVTMAGMIAAVTVKSFREYRHPDRLLQPDEEEVARRVLARRAAGGEPTGIPDESPVEGLIRLQGEMDIILQRDQYVMARLFRWLGSWHVVLAAFVLLIVAVAVAVTTEAPFMSVVVSGALVAGFLAVVSRWEGTKRARVVSWLEAEMEGQRKRLQGGEEGAPVRETDL